MTSQINPNNIDGTYPVAGQDNDSQGFRDNFTNIKTNLGYAATEITDLQNKAILKAALTGSTLNNDMNNQFISNVQLNKASAPREALGTVTGAQTLDFSASPYYTLTTGGAVTVSFTGFPPAGQVARMRLQITVTNTAYTLTVTPSGGAASLVGAYNVQGLDGTTGTITFGRAQTYEYEFETSDGGVTISIFDLNLNRDPVFYPSIDALTTSGSSVALGGTNTIFTTTGSATATMSTGANGQVKLLMAKSLGGGTMTVTVSNAAWGGGGTITFSNDAEACSLIYIDSKWYCTGNNGAVFA